MGYWILSRTTEKSIMNNAVFNQIWTTITVGETENKTQELYSIYILAHHTIIRSYILHHKCFSNSNCYKVSLSTYAQIIWNHKYEQGNTTLSGKIIFIYLTLWILFFIIIMFHLQSSVQNPTMWK
jgi:hypothetical protein